MDGIAAGTTGPTCLRRHLAAEARPCAAASLSVKSRGQRFPPRSNSVINTPSRDCGRATGKPVPSGESTVPSDADDSAAADN